MELVILEVSQKQNYIFSSKRLAENAARSARIRAVTESPFLKWAFPEYDEAAHLFYSGGGHTILRFRGSHAAGDAYRFVKAVTLRAYTEYDGMELFAARVHCEDDDSPAEKLDELMKALEAKKSLRASAFRDKGTGLEAEGETVRRYDVPAEPGAVYQKAHPMLIEDLCGRDNFMAVIHIDGNNMGRRAQEVTRTSGMDWEACRQRHQVFSQGVDAAFQSALRRTIQRIEAQQALGTFESLGFTEQSDYHPCRPVIAAGDDICFVTAGSIGLESAVTFLHFLQNPEDGLSAYSACAGVAIVREKYPFHRAYEMSEALCGNAKKYAASLANSAVSQEEKDKVSTMDWHIEFGQGRESLGAVREDYITEDSGSGASEEDPIATTTLRPLSVIGFSDSEHRTYGSVRTFLAGLGESDFPQSKIKGLRSAVKQGALETELYLRSKQLGKLKELADPAVLCREQRDGKTVFCRRSLYFDAIELLNRTILFREGGQA